ncbi:MAG: hypothetical protein HN855_04420 [Anaerolineae bacterium]|jgi:hypothetical protein|nr:hypothetical protein [Anaerolineae bacterium]MBT7324381.1 hypothetical protein [Anaerolineae bacterium]
MENSKDTPERNVEANEIRDTTQENLDDVTYEPRAHVEKSDDYTQAEDIQKSLTELAENEKEGLAEQVKIRGDLDNITSDQDEEDKDEATPINLPSPQPGQISEEPGHGPNPFTNIAGGPEDVADLPIPIFNEVDSGAEDNVEVSPIPVPLPNPADGGNIASEDDWESPNANITKGGDPHEPPPPPDLSAQRELSPDDVKLEPAPDFEALNEGERAVVDVIGKAITDEEYRAALFADAQAATDSHAVTPEDQAGLSEMTPESFEFFAAEVEARLAATADEQTLAQVVHSVWRDLNPGRLVYVLTYKIPQYHLI